MTRTVWTKDFWKKSRFLDLHGATLKFNILSFHILLDGNIRSLENSLILLKNIDIVNYIAGAKLLSYKAMIDTISTT